MTPEQERAEARINKANIIAWLKHMIERNETMEAHGEASAYKFTLGRIEDGKFDSNSLDREEQLIAEKEELSKNYRTLADDWSIVTTDRDEAIAKVAEQDKEIQHRKKYEGFLKSCIACGESLEKSGFDNYEHWLEKYLSISK